MDYTNFKSSNIVELYTINSEDNFSVGKILAENNFSILFGALDEQGRMDSIKVYSKKAITSIVKKSTYL